MTAQRSNSWIVSRDFGRSIPQVAFAITLTLMMRPVGAFIFGELITRLLVRAGQIAPQARYADSPL